MKACALAVVDRGLTSLSIIAGFGSAAGRRAGCWSFSRWTRVSRSTSKRSLIAIIHHEAQLSLDATVGGLRRPSIVVHTDGEEVENVEEMRNCLTFTETLISSRSQGSRANKSATASFGDEPRKL